MITSKTMLGIVGVSAVFAGTFTVVQNPGLALSIEPKHQQRLAGGVAPENSRTREEVDARYQHAKELARNGEDPKSINKRDAEEALKEFLWCYDLGMVGMPRYHGVRLSFLLSDIARLGERYPAALFALHERRDEARQRLLAGALDSARAVGSESTGIAEFAALNRVLHDDKATLAVFDQLPKGDWRRERLASAAFQLLVAERRYAEALTGRSYSAMLGSFDSRKKERPEPAGARTAERVAQKERDSLVESTAENIEVLAGSGELEDARHLAGRLLRYDASPETKAILQQHLKRAGQPELLGAAAAPGGKE